ncbi:hypothetical protein DM860_003772 [Cuscuta australis]|uniref:PGG domain-containing protein n=1 Tax=Cuscuta australis TaxID=267555 RepID=A0A328DLV4_9ASTE|nr:hypothetical protein DM860_003772 [Cuscuta australis]
MKNKMSMHRKAEKLLHHLCNRIKSRKDHKQVVAVAKSAMFEAARLDMDTVVTSILDTCPTIVYCLDDNKCSVFHIAVENRSENVFNLLCQKSIQMRDLAEMVDVHGNGILHLAGKLAPPHKLNSVSGAALQMQLELQWFEAVEKVVPSYVRSTTNKDLKTPRSVFTEEHKNLKENGERLMKDTANSCTISAALIVTVAFAAAITVPGGNNSDSGHPIFSKKTAFTVFAIANAGSLFTASTSMLAFLSILTSRYAEKDFRLALPRRSIIGLLTLFLSIILMMTAFSATVYLVFGQNQSAIAIAVAVLAGLPVSSFVLLQFPLIVALVSSTYGPGIFRKTKRPTSNRRPKESETQPTDIERGRKIM